MNKLYQGLAILLKYEPDGEASADHDVLYAGETHPSAMLPEDVKALDDLGWHYTDTVGWLKFT